MNTIRFCEENVDESVTLEEVQQALAKIPGSMTADFIAERADRYLPLLSIWP